MKKTIFALAALATFAGSAVVAQDYAQALKARQGQFNILAINLGILGGMARGTVEYDAEAARLPRIPSSPSP